MNKLRHILLALSCCGVALLLSGCHMSLLDPAGLVALREKRLLLTAVILMLIIVIPVIILTVVIAIRYRASNTKASYAPNWSHNTLLEAIWWGIPCAIILALAVITWISSHRLDPYTPLTAFGVDEQPMEIQVVALDWRWLFIYPNEKIATIDFVQIPVNKPVRFNITADAPMNSFQIPRLAGQIYAMPGMRTKLNIIANQTGDFSGQSTNYSGFGFAGMRFVTRVGSQEEFEQWVQSVKQSNNALNWDTYSQLAQPVISDKVEYFSAVSDGLFDKIIMKYMMPTQEQGDKNA